MERTLRESLPPIYEPLLGALFDRSVIVEARATCDDCEMCDKGQRPAGLEVVTFRPDVKCCSFHPSLPNFLAGSVLADERAEMAEGRRRIRALLDKRIGVTPHWLAPSAKYHMLYEAARRSSFGRTEHLICPYFDEGSCSIWRHRESICTTYYCKFSGGVTSARFWNSLKGYLSFIESTLARWSSREVDKDVVEIQSNPHALTIEELEDRPPDMEMYKRHWKSWVGREADFYQACAARVRQMDRATFEKVIDETPRGRDLLTTLKTSYAAAVSPRTPDRLTLHPKLKALPIADRIAVTTPYNQYDVLELEPAVFETLKKLTHDETVAQARERLEREDGAKIDDELLRTLAAHEVVIAPDHPILAQKAKAAETSGEKAADGKEEGA